MHLGKLFPSLKGLIFFSTRFSIQFMLISKRSRLTLQSQKICLFFSYTIFSSKINGIRLYLNIVRTLENEDIGMCKAKQLGSSVIGTEFPGELHNSKADI